MNGEHSKSEVVTSNERVDLLRLAADDCEAEANNCLREAPNLGPTKEQRNRMDAANIMKRVAALRAWANELESLRVETTPERPVRFDLSRSDYDEWSMCPDGTGDYVRWEDVKQFFESSVVEPTAPRDDAGQSQIGRLQAELAVMKKDGRSYEIRRIAGQALEVITRLWAARSPMKATGCTLDGCAMKEAHGHTHLLSCQVWDLTKQPKCTCGAENAAAPTNDCTTCGGLGWIRENEDDIVGCACPGCTPEKAK